MGLYGIIHIDNESRVKLINTDLEINAKIKGEDVYGKMLREVFPGLAEQIELSINDVMRRGKAEVFKKAILDFVERPFDADVYINPVFNRANKFIGCVIKWEMEPPLLAEERSKDKPSKFETVSRLLTELENPITTIKGSAYYLTERFGDNEEIEKFLHIISEEVSRLQNFLIEMFGALVENRSDITEGDVNSLVKSLMLLVCCELEFKKITCDCRYGNLPYVDINYFELGQAILNVLNNSIDYLPPGGRLFVSTDCEDLFEYKFIIISVKILSSDMIPGEMKVRIHDKYEELWIARKILEKYGGNLFVEHSNEFDIRTNLIIPQTYRRGAYGQEKL